MSQTIKESLVGISINNLVKTKLYVLKYQPGFPKHLLKKNYEEYFLDIEVYADKFNVYFKRKLNIDKFYK